MKAMEVTHTFYRTSLTRSDQWWDRWQDFQMPYEAISGGKPWVEGNKLTLDKQSDIEAFELIGKFGNTIQTGELSSIWIEENPSSWENGRIGGGAVPFKIDKGWIKIYHATDKENRYCLCAFLLDLNNPNKILEKTNNPILEPEEIYEKEGFFSNVVFTCGCLLEDNNIIIYYG
ncbi:MAG: hypothetical protein K2F59_05245, partial [Eubacteriales bacterium]|nr:hypothetical protein [Eubacteriales bacterium]